MCGPCGRASRHHITNCQGVWDGRTQISAFPPLVIQGSHTYGNSWQLKTSVNESDGAPRCNARNGAPDLNQFNSCYLMCPWPRAFPHVSLGARYAAADPGWPLNQRYHIYRSQRKSLCNNYQMLYAFTGYVEVSIFNNVVTRIADQRHPDGPRPTQTKRIPPKRGRIRESYALHIRVMVITSLVP